MDFMRTKEKLTAVAHLNNEEICLHARRIALISRVTCLSNYEFRYDWKTRTLSILKKVHLQRAKQLEIMRRFLNRFKEGEDYELEIIKDENN